MLSVVMQHALIACCLSQPFLSGMLRTAESASQGCWPKSLAVPQQILLTAGCMFMVWHACGYKVGSVSDEGSRQMHMLVQQSLFLQKPLWRVPNLFWVVVSAAFWCTSFACRNAARVFLGVRTAAQQVVWYAMGTAC